MRSSKPISLAEVIEFQAKVIDPFLAGSKTALMLEQDQWMGYNGAGENWASLPVEEAEQLIQLLGVGAFKIVRFTPGLLSVIKKALSKYKPIVTAGGSCLITAADNSLWRQQKVDYPTLANRISELPNLMQIFDASIPIAIADRYIDIIEDTLFAQFGSVYTDVSGNEVDLLNAFVSEGGRHTWFFENLCNEFGYDFNVKGAHFSTLNVKQCSDKFWTHPDVVKTLHDMGLNPNEAKEMARTQVMFSFTGMWAEMLRAKGLIPNNACYLVVEPFHHFTETHNVSMMGAADTPLYRLNKAFDLLMRANPYGSGVNSGIQGGIAFLPTITRNGCLGHNNLTNSTVIANYGNYKQVEYYLSEILNAMDKVPCITEDRLFIDGLNYLYHIPECRRALIILSEMWYSILEKSRASGNKHVTKQLQKDARKKHDNVEVAKEQYIILATHLQQIISSIYP